MSAGRTSLPEPGTLLEEGLRVEERLAIGGMGAVYAATRAGAPVAVKILRPEFSRDPEMRRRFRREGSILAALDHPGVVQVIGVGVDACGRCYTVMERLRGETLEARMRRGPPLSPEALLPLAEEMASALGAAHARGILHGDLKPANVFLLEGEAGPRIKLVDFGTSKVHGLERLTRTGEICGTPTYMAPELFTGEAPLEERIDVYSFGALLYEALSGAPPFRERNPGRLMFRIATGDADPLPETIPAPIRQVVAEAMRPRQADRPASVGAVVEGLRRAIEASG